MKQSDRDKKQIREMREIAYFLSDDIYWRTGVAISSDEEVRDIMISNGFITDDEVIYDTNN